MYSASMGVQRSAQPQLWSSHKIAHNWVKHEHYYTAMMAIHEKATNMMH